MTFEGFVIFLAGLVAGFTVAMILFRPTETRASEISVTLGKPADKPPQNPL